MKINEIINRDRYTFDRMVSGDVANAVLITTTYFKIKY